MEALDPMQFVSYRLYRFATQYKKGAYYKDISKLNRDPSKILVLGVDDHFVSAEDNMIQVPPWTGNADDSKLEEYINCLESSFILFFHSVSLSCLS